MNHATPEVGSQGTSPANGNVESLEGEAGIPSVDQPRRVKLSRKGVLALVLLCVTVVVAAGLAIDRWLGGMRRGPAAESTRMTDRPAAASAEPRRLDLSVPRRPPEEPGRPAAASAPLLIPAITAQADDTQAEPIGVRRTGQADPERARRQVTPEDAPAVLVTSRPAPASPGQKSGATTSAPADPLDATRSNLDAYQRQLQTLLDTLSKTASPATAASIVDSPSSPAATIPPGTGWALPGAGQPNIGSGLFGGQLQGSATPRVAATMLGNRSLVLPKGTAFTCALKTRVVSAVSGFIGCQVLRNVYSDDGRVLLVERGSHMDGEYRATSIRPGTVRIPVMWTRIRTPNGVTVDIESPGTGQLGESGIDGYVDNRWVERIGAAMLVSLINDAVQLVIQTQTNEGSGDTIIFPSTTASTSKLAEKVLESTINIPPLIYQNQGGIVGIYVARDVDFSSVYELRPVAR